MTRRLASRPTADRVAPEQIAPEHGTHRSDSDNADLALARWRALAEVSPDFVMLTDLAGRIEYLNRTNGRIPLDTYLGREVCSLLHAPHAQVLEACLQRVNSSGKIDQCEVEFINRDGESRHFEIRVGPVIDVATVVGLALNGRDVTSQRLRETSPSRRLWTARRGRAKWCRVSQTVPCPRRRPRMAPPLSPRPAAMPMVIRKRRWKRIPEHSWCTAVSRRDASLLAPTDAVLLPLWMNCST